MKFVYFLFLFSFFTFTYSMESDTNSGTSKKEYEAPEEFLQNSIAKMITCAEQAQIPTNKGLAGIFQKMQQQGPTSLFSKENEKYMQRAEELYDRLQLNDATKSVIKALEDKKAAFEKIKEEYNAARDIYEKRMLVEIANYLKCNCPQFKFPETTNLAEKLASKGEAAIEDNKEILILNQDFANTPEHEEWIILTCLLRAKIFSTLQSSD